jgi:hypothetical protein
MHLLALLADIEETLVAVVEGSTRLHAELALPLDPHPTLTQWVLVVAGGQLNRLALEAVGSFVLFAVVAGQSDYLLLLALSADICVVLFPAYVH